MTRQSRAIASGRRAPSVCFWSMYCAVEPPTSASPGKLRSSWTSRCEAGSRKDAPEEARTSQAPGASRRGEHERRVWQTASRRGVGLRRRVAVDDRVGRRDERRGEVLPQGGVDDPRADARRQHGRVDAGEPRREKRQTEHEEQSGRRDRDRPRPPHQRLREPVPAALLAGRRALHRPPPARQRPGVHARAEEDEERGQHGQRDQPGKRPDEPAGDPHRLEKPEREDRHRRDRRAHRDRRERDRPARRRECRAHRIRARPMADKLLPVARDEEQAVVDAESEARPR